MSIKNALDQYYTNPVYAKHCFDLVKNYFRNNDIVDDFHYMEPCVGMGSFYNLFDENRRFGFDLEPKIHDENIKTCDFLTPFLLKEYSELNLTVISNPPFGKNCSLAVKFFNTCAREKNIKYIAFVLPKSFNKLSMQNSLNTSFHLVLCEDTPPKSFLLNNEEYNVPCTFQIWERRDEYREIVKLKNKTELFEKTDKKSANLLIQRVGRRAGELRSKSDNISDTCMYYFKTDNLLEIINVLQSENYLNEIKMLRAYTSAVHSISIPELIYCIEKFIQI